MVGTVVGYEDPQPRGSRWVLSARNTRYLCFGPMTNPRLKPGDRVVVRGRPGALSAPRNPFEFDYARHLERQGIGARLMVRKVILTGRAATSGQLVWRWLAPLRYRVQDRLMAARLPAETRGILLAVTLGHKGLMPAWQRDRFAAAGVAHLFAVSGLHLGCVSFLFLGMASAVGMLILPWRPNGRRKLRWVAAWAGGGIFLVVTGAPLSCVRAFTMLSGLALARLFDREYDVWTWLAASSLAILSWNPHAMFRPGFQLSTVSVAAIVFLLPRLAPPPVAAWWRRVAPAGRPSVVRTGLWLMAIAGASLAASIATLPIIWCHFSVIPLLGVPVNLVVLPLVWLYILPAGLAYAFIPGGESLLALVVEKSLSATVFVVNAFVTTAVEVVGWQSPAWPGLAASLCIAGGLFVAAASPWLRVRAGGLLLTLAVALWWPDPSAHDGNRVRFFHVGNGDAALISLTNHRNLIIDGGPEGAGRRVILPFLRRTGRRRIDLLFITHGHADHWRGVAEIASQVAICTIVTNGSLMARRAARVIAVRTPGCGDGPPRVLAARRNDRFRWPKLELEVLWPPPGPIGEIWDENDRSLVLLARAGGTRILFAGDLEGAEAGQAVAESLHASGSGPEDSAGATWLKAPHHGRAGAALPLLVEALDPDVVVVPGDARRVWWQGLMLGGRGRWPRPLVLATSRDGAVTLRLLPRPVFHAFRLERPLG